MIRDMKKSYRGVAVALLMGLMSISPLASAQSQDATSLREAREAAEVRDQQRLINLLDDQASLEDALDQARTRQQAAQERNEALQAQETAQSVEAERLSARQSEQGEALSNLLAALNEHSSEVRNALGDDSWLTLNEEALPPRLSDVDVLEREVLEDVVDSLAKLTQNTGSAERLERPVADANGEVSTQTIVRLGDFAAFTESDLLRQDDEGHLAVLPRTPAEVADYLADYHQGETRVFAMDPTQDSVIDALAQRPTLMERFHQGGYVGYVVVALGGIGLLVAMLQYLYLLVTSQRVNRQLKHPDQLQANNPLGRVLLRFEEMDKHQTPEALEARLDEAVLAELPRLERGQPIVKLLAAIAPLLGLLGTVTGMIVTFQAITVFGTGDPQFMAGGISQALVTTVLGLITAVPLLFAQTALSSRSRYLTHVIEGQASATLADHLEAHQPAHASPVT
ncbi:MULTISPECIES: MotA/TolQ/ExbB proton channel family protein [unclassified Halomonas]|uniref:MotA/TolQ/ExbB proton channel family protein n=1 Tax=unclassified Halomonas TaxID=2609666 RepID=UPI0006D95249|nr:MULTISPECIES: MotA/TolQ/ExbB proton channel family protein [unclassified Halomonas]KPQ22197.1 MAG: outer membrane transport energization protein ExbB [Halomonas sp. HL-93]SBR49467.1 outer membrane transport energization protein ExbB [Halomonas sp. HL-93]SNY96386.1 outer membrane transport energization protein ExbB [Halomonas sp. hl-4]